MPRDPRVDTYIERAAEFARPILTHIRERVDAALPEAEETLKWGAPAFTLNGKILLGMAAFKQHAALNFWRGQELRGSEAKADGMGQFGRLTSLADLPDDAELDSLFREAADLSRTAPAPRQPKPVRAEPEMHPAFAEALAATPAAADFFARSAPSCRREYLEWIADAKRDETRAKRIAKAVEQLAEGKKLNWKYEKC